MLIVYSGCVPELDLVLAKRLAEKGGVLTVIPTTPAEYEVAGYIAEYYLELGIEAQSLSKSDYEDAEHLKQTILSSNAVYLMGGNTYESLAFARSSGLFACLAQLEANGGVIAGESAGSIILSDTIATAGLPTSDPDENTLNMLNFEAMGRLAFHISPHFDYDKEDLAVDLDELQTLANTSNQDVLLLEDGEGFVMEGDVIQQFVGEVKVLKPQAQSEDQLSKKAFISNALSAN